MPPYWLTYFGVGDCDQAVATATALGATVMQPPMDIPPGRFALLIDPVGAMFAVLALAAPPSVVGPGVDPETMRRRVGDARVARLATVRPDGRPHVVTCCFTLEGDTVYTAVDGKPKSTLALQRVANLAAHPEASLLIDHYDDDWSALWWVRVDGTARTVTGADRGSALDRLAAKYRQYREMPPPGSVIAVDLAGWTAWP